MKNLQIQIFFKCFWKRRKFATKWYITHFVFIFSQLSEIVLGS